MMDEIYTPLAATILTLRDLNPDDERLAQLDFHLKTGDYFAVIATIMGFVEDTLAGADAVNPALKERELALLMDLKKDLIYLQEHYRIEPK